jgi:hypothetical protein
VQAQTVYIEQHIHHGLTQEQTRAELLALFEDNFYRLQSLARQTAEERAAAITERFLAELMRHNPAGLESAQDPDMQAAIFTAQREYARSGRQDLEEVLIDLLVQRSGATDLKQIVLNGAIDAAATLTSQQLDTLSFLLVFVHQAPLRYSFETLEEFGAYLHANVAPLLNDSLTDPSAFLHFKYAGCASVDSEGASMIQRIQAAFPGCFTYGFDRSQTAKSEGLISDLLRPCLHGELWQFRPCDRITFGSICKARGIGPAEIYRLQFIQANHMMDEETAYGLLAELEPAFSAFPEGGLHHPLEHAQLTTVGIALANANLRRKVGLEFDLGQWIK